MEENQKRILEELDQAVIETLEMVNDEETEGEQLGASIKASEILSRTRNEMLKTTAEIEKIRADAELEKIKADAEIERVQAESDKLKMEAELSKRDFDVQNKHYWVDHLVNSLGLGAVLYYERANIIGSKTFQSIWGTFTKGFSRTMRCFRRK